MAEYSDRPTSRRLISLRPALAFLRPYVGRVALASVALVLTAGVTLAVGQGLKALVDAGFNGAALGDAMWFFGGLVVLLTIGTFVRFYLVSWVGERVSADIRLAVYQHLIGLDAVFFERNQAGEIQSRLTTDTTLLQTVIGSSVSIALRNVLMFFGGLVFMVASNPKLAAVVLVSVPLMIGPVMFFGRRVRTLSRDSQDTIANVGSYVNESLQQIKTVKAFGHEPVDVARFTERVEAAFSVARERISKRALLTAVVMLLVFGAVGGMLWVGGRDVIAGRITAGELTAFVFYAVVVAGSLGAISEVIGDLQRAAGAMERLMELLHAGSEVVTPAQPRALSKPVSGAIEVAGVDFSYPTRPDVQVLSNVTFTIAPGATVAIVGPSGAGKSTLFDLILRFYDPTGGQITLDGIPLQQLALVDLRQVMGLVPQQPVLFSGSLADNIRYGRPSATEEEIARVIAAAHLSEVIAELPDGADTQLGEFGVGLSGGQRQRVAIARPMLKDPKVLLLDEATSALDAQSEQTVQLALDALAAERTTIVIAHRLATVRDADLIVVLEQGRIVASGTHDALLTSSPLYANLAALQFGTPSPAEPLSAVSGS